jgi:hypothetical protein
VLLEPLARLCEPENDGEDIGRAFTADLVDIAMEDSRSRAPRCRHGVLRRAEIARNLERQALARSSASAKVGAKDRRDQRRSRDDPRPSSGSTARRVPVPTVAEERAERLQSLRALCPDLDRLRRSICAAALLSQMAACCSKSSATRPESPSANCRARCARTRRRSGRRFSRCMTYHPRAERPRRYASQGLSAAQIASLDRAR